MGKSWGRKYISFHTTRTTPTVATAVTFALCFLLYVNLWSSATNMTKSSKNTHHHQHDPPSTPLPHQQPNKVKENAGSRPKNWHQVHPDSHNIFQSVKTNGVFSGQAQLVKPMDKNSKSKDSSRQMTYIPHTKEEDSLAKLHRIFKKADINKDSHLSFLELSNWINERVRAHFATALRDNFDSFFGIDRNPRNGRVEWSEYLDFHLRNNMNYNGPPITPEIIQKRTEIYKNLSKDIKVEIAALEAKFSENASNDPDYLTVDEFLAFIHPEASPTKLLASVQDTFSTFDLDGDGIITKTEFDTTYAEAEGVDSVYKEDLHLIDTDKNKQISRVELMRYMDPKNTIHSDKDAHALINKLDEDKDEMLTMGELKKDLKYVFNSKLFDAAKNLHRGYQLHS